MIGDPAQHSPRRGGASLDRMAERGELSAPLARRLGQALAGAQLQVPAVPAAHAGGRSSLLRRRLGAVTLRLRDRLDDAGACAALESLHRQLEAERTRQAPRLAARRAAGFVREGHGDLGLAHWTWLEPKSARPGGRADAQVGEERHRPGGFDAPEGCLVPTLSPAGSRGRHALDTAAELASPFMDLLRLRQPQQAWSLVDGWLQASRDPGALAVLPLFASLRALSWVTRRTPTADVRAQIALASRLIDSGLAPRLVVLSGLPASGRTTVAETLAPRLGAVVVRAQTLTMPRPVVSGDRVQPRGLPVPGLAASVDDPDEEESPAVQAALLGAVRELLLEGCAVVVDAMALRHAERSAWLELADSVGAVAQLLECHAPLSLLRHRLEAGSTQGVARLARQLFRIEPLQAAERARATTLATDDDHLDRLSARCDELANRLNAMADKLQPDRLGWSAPAP